MNLVPILEKYKGLKLFEEEQRQFKIEFFKELFDPYKEVDYSQRTPLFLNAILEEENLPYIIAILIPGDDVEEQYQNKIYWKIYKIA